MRGVDQLGAALGDLAGKDAAQRPDAAADAVAGLEHLRPSALAGQHRGGIQSGEAGADDRHVGAAGPGCRTQRQRR